MEPGARNHADGALDRAFRVLGCFSEANPELTASEIAARPGLALSTVHRLLARLIELRAIERTSEHSYAPGMGIWQVGELSPVALRLREQAVPYLARLYEAIGETVHLAVIDAPAPARASAVLVARMIGEHSLPTTGRPGGNYPLHAMAVGKVLLSDAIEDWLSDYFSAPLTAQTPRSITTERALRAELARVRAKGYATTADEMRLGTGSVASRVPVPEGMPRAALGIVVAAEHVHERRLAALVTRAARELGRELRASALPWRA